MEWTWAGRHVPGLDGQGLYLIAPCDLDQVSNTLRDNGYHVVELDGSAATGKTAALAAITRALKLPGTAAGNYDALADSLTDLPAGTPQRRVVLLWDHADALIGNDIRAWTTLTGILTDASLGLWDLDDENADTNTVFETVAVVNGFGVEPLDAH